MQLSGAPWGICNTALQPPAHSTAEAVATARVVLARVLLLISLLFLCVLLACTKRCREALCGVRLLLFLPSFSPASRDESPRR